jgi:putative flippase GtrA
MTAPLLSRLMASEKARFLVVGGINTVVAYGLFVLFQLTVGDTIGYFGSLYLSYALAILLAFVLHRRFTFQVRGQRMIVVDFLRFVSVYAVTIVINTVALPLLVEVVGLHPVLAQALCVLVAMAISFVGHKWFSFRRPAA